MQQFLLGLQPMLRMLALHCHYGLRRHGLTEAMKNAGVLRTTYIIMNALQQFLSSIRR
jgi:hypothetical protein